MANSHSAWLAPAFRMALLFIVRSKVEKDRSRGQHVWLNSWVKMVMDSIAPWTCVHCYSFNAADRRRPFSDQFKTPFYVSDYLFRPLCQTFFHVSDYLFRPLFQTIFHVSDHLFQTIFHVSDHLFRLPFRPPFYLAARRRKGLLYYTTSTQGCSWESHIGLMSSSLRMPLSLALLSLSSRSASVLSCNLVYRMAGRYLPNPMYMGGNLNTLIEVDELPTSHPVCKISGNMLPL